MKIKYILIITLIFILSLYSTYSTVKLEKIGIIDLMKIIEEVYKEKNEQVKNYIVLKNNLQNELNSIRNEIVTRQNKLKQNKSNTSNSEIQIEINQFKEKYINLYKSKITEIEQAEKTFISLYSNDIFDFVRKYSEKNAYTLILKHNSENVYYFSPQSDISMDIIKLMTNQ